MQIAPFGAGSALRKEVHGRLAKQLHSVSLGANVPAEFIVRSMSETCDDELVDWVRRFPQHAANDHFGLTLSGSAAEAQEQMLAIGGALIRNFIGARVLSLQQLLDEDERDTETTVLLIPNFHSNGALSEGLPAWRVSVLYDLLLTRVIRRKQTVIYVSSLSALGKNYGTDMRKLIEAHFLSIE